MCNACGFPTAPGHWTDAGADTPGDRLRMQFRRAQVLKKILSGSGLTANVDGHIPGLQLASLTGGSVILRDLEALWVEVERQTGRPLDPLAPEFTTPTA
jgi:hypothetical protein